MCGRFYLIHSPFDVKMAFGYGDNPNFPPRFNIAPTQPVAVVTAEQRFTLMRWGFLPSWVKDTARFPLLFNARLEEVTEKASFKHAIRRRRALIPASGYYEWRRAGKAKVPFKIARADGELMGLAALHETWMGPGGEELDTVAILTAEAVGTLQSIHHRMPVVVRPEAYDQWLSGGEAATQAALSAANDRFTDLEPIAISSRVNKVGEEGPELHEEDHEIMRPKDLFG